MEIKEFLSNLEKQNFSLAVKDGKLSLKADKKVTTKEQIEAVKNNSDIIDYIRNRKDELIEYISLLPQIPSDKLNGGGISRLSSLQEGMLFHSLYDSTQGDYVEQFICDLENLDIEVFIDSWNEVLKRHSILRTAFFYDTFSIPVQRVYKQVTLPFKEVDLRSLDGSSQEEYFDQYLKTDREEGFDFKSAPLMRLSFVRLGDTTYRFLWSSHHILFDGWSMPVMLRELLAIYEALLNKEQLPAFAEDKYEDYIRYLEKIDKWQEEEYWKKYLNGVTQGSALPFIKRSLGKDNSASTVSKKINAAVSEKIHEYTKNNRITVNTLMQGVWSLLLNRYTGLTDALYGVVVSGRPDELPNVEHRVGLYINTIPFRASFGQDQDIENWLQQLQADQVASRNYQHTALQNIGQWTGLHGSLFDTLLVFENYPIGDSVSTTKSSLKVSNLTVHEQTNYPLTILIADGSEVSLSFNYKKEVLLADNVLDIADQFEFVLQQIVNGSARLLSDVSTITPAIQSKLESFNNTDSDLSQPENLIVIFEEQVQKTPDAIAVSFEHEKLTYAELNARANQLARYLQLNGVGAETLVPICLDRSLEMLIGIVGILKAGAAYVPVDPEYPQERVSFMLSDTGAQLVLCNAASQAKLNDTGLKLILLDSDWAEIAAQDNQNINNTISSNQLAYVIYTSGSTGTPKGAMNEHGGIVNRLIWTQAYFQLTQEDIVLQKTTFCFDVSVWELLWPILTGAKLVFATPGAQGDSTYLKTTIEDEGVTLLHFVPPMLQVFLQDVTKGDCQKLKNVICSGEALTVPQLKLFREKMPHATLHNLYGPTEAAIDVSYWTDTDKQEDIDLIPIGKPIFNTHLYIKDLQGDLCGVGVPGELLIGGIQVARGYLNRGELTREKFITDPHSSRPKERLYRTGDLARWLPDGNIEYLGRIDNQVKIRGFRIELGEIENVILRSELAQQTVVLTTPDLQGDKRLVAYIVAENYNKEEIINYLRTQLPDYMVPQLWVHMESFPINANGKIDRKALPAADATVFSKESYVAPRNETEKQLAIIWQTALGIERIGIFDNFFELGGHSLLAMRVVMQIRRELASDLAIRDLFNYPVIADLSTHLTKGSPIADQAITVQIRPEYIPLSYSQERLWFIDKLEGSLQYHLPAVLNLKGSLDVNVLEKAITSIVDRHEILRTVIKEHEGRGYQLINAPGKWLLKQANAADVEDLDAYIRNLIDNPFDLAHDDMLRAELISVSEDNYILVMTIHHIASDGWSSSILVNELIELYAAISQKRQPPLKSLPIQYADYAVWQRNDANTQALEKGLTYWKSKLEEVPTLQISTDRNRQIVQSTKGRLHKFQISQEQTAKLNNLSLQQGATLYMTMLSVFNILLYRYSGQDDICVGTPVANRDQQEIENLIGFFVNTLALRNKVKSDEPFTALLAQVKTTLLEAYEHKEVPFEKIVEAVVKDRDFQLNPLFQVMFVLQNIPNVPKIKLGELELSAGEIGEFSTRFDFSFDLQETDSGVRGLIEYNPDLFESDTIQRMADHYLQLIDSVVNEPEGEVGKLKMLTENELLNWEQINQTSVSYPVDENIATLFEKKVAKTPDNTALVFEDSTLSYKELNERSNRLAHYLINRGIVAETRVAICLERNPNLIVCLLGVLKAGATYIPVDPEYPKERIKYMLADSGASLVITSIENKDKINDFGEIITIDGKDAEDISIQSIENAGATVNNIHLAYIIYTSGSTGRPKGVMVKHGNILNYCLGFIDYFEVTANDTAMHQSSISFDTMCEEIYPTLIAGAKIILVKEGGRDIDAVKHHIISDKVTLLSGTPTLISYLNESLIVPDTLRHIIVGGEKLQPNFIDNFIEKVKITNSYGPSETTVCATYNMVDKLESASIIGRPVTNTQVYIVNKDGELNPVGVPGEVYIGGAQVSRGYLNQPTLTDEKFVPDSYNTNSGGRLYRTGDIGKLLPDGTIDYIGRADDQVKIRGYRIELGEIENALLLLKELQQAVVLAKPDKNGNSYLAAYIVANGNFDKDGAIAQLKNSLPDYMIPYVWVELDDLPVTGSGKIDKKALPEHDYLAQVADDYVAPRNETELVLSKIWKDLLKVDKVGIYDNFFELGGHSLLAMRVLSQIRQKLNQEVVIRDLFLFPKIADLANKISQTQQTFDSQQITRQTRPDNIPLSYSQERLWFIDRLEGSIQYHLSGVLKITGKINTDALQHAIQGVVDRHEILRTVITEQDGRGYQHVKEKGGWQLEIENEVVYKEDDQALKARVNTIIAKPFDLHRDDMLRCTLIRINDDLHVLVAVMHHIASDAWSMPVLVNEMATLYNAYALGENISLPELPLQFADYAIWQRGNIREEQVEDKLNYWKTKLLEVPVLQLPADHTRPVGPNRQGANQLFVIDEKITDGLHLLSKKQGVTLYMTLLSAFNVLLYNYSGQDDICVGTSIAGRPQTELEELIGFFVNTLALRNTVKGEDKFTDLLSQVKETTLEAYGHQEVPFEKVVEAVVKERTAGVSPLFQVMLVLGNTPTVPELKLGDLTLTNFDRDHSDTKFDLTFFVSENAGTLQCVAQYNADIYSSERIERMAGHFRTLLAAVVAVPESLVGQLNMLPLQQKEQLLSIGRSISAYPHDKNISDIFEQVAGINADNKAVVFEGQSFTYKELNSRANKLAHHLIRKGVGADVLVPLYAERNLDMLTGILGILKAGGVYVPIDTDFPKERVRHIIEDTRAKIAVSSSRHVGELTAIDADLNVIELEELDWSLVVEPETDPQRELSPDNAAYVIYTSGSTGKPKGVLITHRNLVDYVYGLDLRTQISTCKSFALVSTIATDLGNTVLYSSLCFGGALHVFTKETTSNIEAIHEYFDENRIDCVKIVPSHWAALSFDTPLLPAKMIVFGGEALTGEMVDKIRRFSDCRVINHYGPTETTVGKLLYEVAESDTGNIPIGRPFSNTTIYVLNKDKRLCPIGVPGELHIGGTGLAKEYYNNPELTEEKFIIDPFGNGEERIYKTGDLVQYRADVYIQYLGRIDDQVKIRGYRVEPGEIQRTLELNDSIDRALVLSRKDKYGNNQLVAYVIVNSVFDREAIVDFLKESLQDYMVPAHIIQISEVPLTHGGKLDRKALPDPELEVVPTDNGLPSSEIELKLAEIWKDVLELDTIGVNDDFFELGGHSLLAVRLISSVRKTFAMELPISDVFDYPTISKLASRIGLSDDEGALPAIVPQLRPHHIPLSYSQERTWFIDRMDGSSQYHIPSVLKLKGRLNISALNAAFRQIVNRHEVLRTAIREFEGKGYQYVLPPETWSLKTTKFNDIEYLGLEISPYLQKQIGQPFNLETDTMMRAELIEMGEDDHILLVTLHHIASDGWSTSILVDELAALYKAQIAQPEISVSKVLEELPIQYADFAIWQRNNLSGDFLEGKLSYWKNKLMGATPLLLPADYERPAIMTNNGGTMPVVIDKLLSNQLNDLSKKANTTLYMTLLAAFKVLLSRYSGQSDITVGTPVSGRNVKEVEGLIGFFINTLALRNQINGSDSFLKLLQQIRENTLEAYNHQDVPFEKVVEAVVKERDLSRSPLFQVMFVLQNTPPIPVLRLGDVSLSSEGVQDHTTKFDISLSLTETPEGIRGGLEYNSDIYEAGTISQMLTHFNILLQSLVLSPEKSVGEVNLLTDVERHQQLSIFNSSQADYNSAISISGFFEQQVLNTPDAIALEFNEIQLSYKELNQRSNRLARYLVANGVQKETLVPVFIERSIDMIVAILAILKAGGVYVPLDSEFPQERINYLLDDTKAEIILTSKAKKELLSDKNIVVISFDDYTDDILNQDDNDLQLNIDPSQLGYVIYTSGSTGRPKGVMVEQRGLVNLATAQRRLYNINTGTRMLQFASLSFDASCVEIFTTLTSGGCLVLCEKETLLSAQLFNQLLSKHKIEVVILPPTFQQFIDDVPPHTLKIVISAGEALNKAATLKLQSHGIRVFNGYGPTEATVCASITDAPIKPDGTITIGIPTDNTKIYILNLEGQINPVGVTGEICIGGVQVARGYLGKKELTAEKFIPDTFGGNMAARLYRTNDLGRWLGDGSIEYLGRADDQVKVRGFRIELGEIEEAILRSGLVKQTVVIAQPDAYGTNQLLAYIVTADNFRKPELIAYLSNQLPEYMIPARWTTMSAFSLTTSGKIDRQSLPEADMLEERSSDIVLPGNELEKGIAGVWMELLRVAQLGINDNFFELGGHSIMAMQLIVMLRNRVGVDITVRDLFINPTIAKLAERIQSQRADSYQSLIPIKATGNKVPLYIVAGAGGTAFKFQTLVKYLDPDQPVYGLQQPLHNTDPDKFPDTIEEIAKSYLTEILRDNPNGQYALAGHCLGGMIAIELAEQLKALGKKVTMLAMFDADAKPLNGVVPVVSLGSKLKRGLMVLTTKIKFEFFLLFKHPKLALQYKLKKFQPYLANQDARTPDVDQEVFDKITSKIDQAADSYVIKPYNADIVLFNATRNYYFIDKVNKIVYKEVDVNYEAKHAWGDYSPSIKVHQVQGEHSTIFEEHNVPELAGILQQYLNAGAATNN